MKNDPFRSFAERMMHPDSKWIPEILRSMITVEQTELLLALPGTAEQMAGKLARPADKVAAELDDMFTKGLAFKKEKGGSVQWRPPMHIAQLHDASILWPRAPESFYTLWQKYMEEEWPKLAPIIGQFLPRPMTRVIPVNKSIDTGKVQVLAPENLREILMTSTRIAVTKCTCRTTMRRCDGPVEVCLQINRGADYTIERGSGREVTREEALDIARAAEEAGLVHVTVNKSDAGTFVCNCCGCCCQAFSMLISSGVKLCDPSRYRPEVNAGLCKGCGTCADRCWFGAVSVAGDGPSAVAGEKCLGCGLCAAACPQGALAMVEVRKPDFIPT